jgi:drug/metabolite transporter (DMT)-like permease
VGGGLCLLVQPVIAAAIGLTLFGEKLGAVDMTGALLVLIGLVLVRVPDAKLRQTTPPS